MSELCLLKASQNGSAIRVYFFLRHYRMRMRVLSLPSCPDFRKIRVGNADVDETPTEWEMEQIALDKLKLKRQQSLAQRHIELKSLARSLSEENNEAVNIPTPTDFLLPNGDFSEDHLLNHPPAFRRAAPSQSLSLQNLVQFGQMSPSERLHMSPKKSHLSPGQMIMAQRKKKLKEIQSELDAFKAIHFGREESTDGNGKADSGMLNSKPSEFRGSNLSLVSFDAIANENGVPEISHRIQKMRERELRKIRRENFILEYQLKEKLHE